MKKQIKQQTKQDNSNGDVAKDHELGFAVMNLIAIEEHLAFTIAKTKKSEYIDIYNQIRALRSKYLKEIVKNKDGEMWCVSKHLLSTTMRLVETGIKYGVDGKKEKAISLFSDAMDVFLIFWLIQKLG